VTADRTRRALELYEESAELAPGERDRFLERACGADAALRREVERMLAVEAAPGFLELGRAAPAPPPDEAGRRIGPFELVRRLGAGGMGVVYEARQEHPRRRVALKMLRTDFAAPGGDRRFRAEIELLARLSHPGIARVLEAGVHVGDDGGERAWFAVELVEGARDLLAWGRGRDLRERVEQLAAVCDAVHHGHRRGVLHRDLKPANVLVGKDGIAKVIDFGVARALDGGPDAAGRVTRTGELVGTLHHMAPEQLGEGRGDVEARTDVYALGLLLYELVCDAPPYDLAHRSLTEVARIIRDVPPAPPRAAAPGVPRDLGRIALRALEKDPERRYASVSELAADLRRFLDGRPVEAGPPGRLYALGKLARRHWPLVGAAGLVVAALAVGGAVSFAALLRANVENEKFRSINAVLADVFASVRAEEDGHDVRAADLLDRAAERLDAEARPEVRAPLLQILAESEYGLGRYGRAAEHGRAALALGEHLTRTERLGAAYVVGQALVRLDRLDEARARIDAELGAELARAGARAPQDAALLSLRQLDAVLLGLEGRPAEAVARLEALVAESRRALGPDADATADIEGSLVDALLEAGRVAAAERRARDLVTSVERRHGAGTEPTFDARALLGRALRHGHRYDEAVALHEALADDCARVLGPDHPRTRVAVHELASAYVLDGRHARALPLLEDVVQALEEHLGPQHAETLTAKSSLAQARASIAPAAAEELYREALDARRRRFGDDDRRTLAAAARLGRFLRQAGRATEAEPLLVDVFERHRRLSGDDELERHASAVELGMLRFAQGRSDEACRLLREGWRGYQRRLDAADPRRLVAGNNYATALVAGERWDEAVDVLTEVYADMRAGLAADDPRQLAALATLAYAHGRRGEPGRAIELSRRAASWAAEHLPASHPRRIDADENLALALAAAGRFDAALEAFERALAAAELNPAVADSERAAYRLGYARCLRSAGRRAAAARELRRLLESERARLGPGHAGWYAELEAELAAVEAEPAAPGDLAPE